MRQASEISDRLAEALEACGRLAEARDAMAAAAAARGVLFGRHLVVARTHRKLAALHLKLKQPDAAKAADGCLRTAVAISEAELQRASKRPLLGWAAAPPSAEATSTRLRAALEYGAALRDAAALAVAAPGAAPGAGEAALRPAASALALVLAEALPALGALAASDAPRDAAAFDKLTGVYVELQILQTEVLEALLGALKARGGPGAPEAAAAVAAQLDALARSMV
jgi:hypothetical protein